MDVLFSKSLCGVKMSFKASIMGAVGEKKATTLRRAET